VVSSEIIASGKVDKILPDIWEIASAGNDAQLAGNLSVVLAVLKVIHFAPLSRRQAGALASLSRRHSLMCEAPIERRYLRSPRFPIEFGSFFTQIEIVKDQDEVAVRLGRSKTSWSSSGMRPVCQRRVDQKRFAVRPNSYKSCIKKARSMVREPI